MRDKGGHKEEGKREEEKGKGKKIKENKRNAKSGSDDRWARVEVHPDRCTSSPSQQPTPSRILTPSLSRGKAHPLCLSARGTGGRQATLEFIVHLADVERPSTMPQFLSSFSLFWPVSSPGRGLNDFNHPLSSLFFLQFYFKFSPPLPAFFSGKTRVRWDERRVGDAKLWLCPLNPWKRSPLARFRRNSIDTHIVPRRRRRGISSVNWLHCHLFMPRLRGDRRLSGQVLLY